MTFNIIITYRLTRRGPRSRCLMAALYKRPVISSDVCSVAVIAIAIVSVIGHLYSATHESRFRCVSDERQCYQYQMKWTYTAGVSRKQRKRKADEQFCIFMISLEEEK